MRKTSIRSKGQSETEKPRYNVGTTVRIEMDYLISDFDTEDPELTQLESKLHKALE